MQFRNPNLNPNALPARTGIDATAWDGWVDTVTVSSCRAGHFLMEENPQAVLAAFLPHFQVG